MRLLLRAAFAAPTYPRHSLTPIALVVCLGAGAVVHAQDTAAPASTASEPALSLRPTGLLSEGISAQQKAQAPMFLLGDRISGRPDLETVLATAPFYRLSPTQAGGIIDQVVAVVTTWASAARRAGIASADIELMRSAFGAIDGFP